MPDTDTGPDLSLDASGRYANPVAINDMQQTTKFHPSELPANPLARAAFPKHLVSEDAVTESPASDSSVTRRLEAGMHNIEHAAERFFEDLAGKTELEPEAQEAPGDGVEKEGLDVPADGTEAELEVPADTTVEPVTEEPVEIPVGEAGVLVTPDEPPADAPAA